jgi:hypothetical protein
MICLGQADFVGFCMRDKDLSLEPWSRLKGKRESYRKEDHTGETECSFEHPEANCLSRRGDADEEVPVKEKE